MQTDREQFADADPRGIELSFPVIPFIRGCKNNWADLILTKEEAQTLRNFLNKEQNLLKPIIGRQVHQLYHDILYCFRAVLIQLVKELKSRTTETAAAPVNDPNDSDDSIDGVDQDLAAETK